MVHDLTVDRLPGRGRTGGPKAHSPVPLRGPAFLMLAHVLTGTVHGLESIPVRVEVNLAAGLPAFTVVGLPDGAVRESRERVATAVRNAGFALPNRRITVSLSPAHVRKEGAGLDLPIAVGLLAASGVIRDAQVQRTGFLAELGLDARLRPVPGVLPVAAELAARGLVDQFVVARENAREAALVDGVRVVGVEGLADVVDHLSGVRPGRVERTGFGCDAGVTGVSAAGPDLVDIRGQGTARRALEVAAAGGHNLLLVGPPGAGKTMLAVRMPGLLPPLTWEEALECTRVHSVAGLLEADEPLVRAPPFRAPHHSVSDAGLGGGGTPLRPGEISLAHHGVLFLDELPEFRRSALEMLRQPLEEGRVRISRAHGAASFPARFMLVAAMNPCPCGHLGDGTDRCLCDPMAVSRYQARVSGPLLDRIDLHVYVPPVGSRALGAEEGGEGSAAVRDRVRAARAAQRARSGGNPGTGGVNALMGPAALSRWGRPTPRGRALLERAVDRMGLSARGFHRVQRVARTLADLDGSEAVDARHVAEALHFRGLETEGR